MRPKLQLPIRLSTLLILILFFIVDACRKLDSDTRLENSKKPTRSDEIIKKFFTMPESVNERVKAIAKSIERQNEQRKFIEELVTRVGYPRWDKTLIASKNGINARSSEIGDSSSIVYISFSKPDDNNTAAILAVGLNYLPNDTLYHMLYPNQYKQYTFDTSNTKDWNARTVFHLFTEFDYQIFGNTIIKITDGRILGGAFDDTVMITRDLNNGNTAQRTEDFVLITVCTAYGSSALARLNSNNRSNSFARYFPICSSFWVDDPSNPGPLSLPSGDGTGGSANGGAGYSTQTDGHWETIPPCPEEGERVAGRTNSQSLLCSFIGWQYIWVPNQGSFNPYIYDTIGISQALETVFPCLYAFLNDSLPNANLLAQLAGGNVFKDSVYMHLTFDTSTTLISGGQAAADTGPGNVTVESDGTTHFRAVIKFNGYYLRHASKEDMITTIVHESMHAVFALRWGQYQKWLQFGPPNDIDSNWIKAHYPSQWYALTNQTRPLSELQEHEIMAADYMELFKNTVQQFWNPAAPQAIRDSTIKALCWGGLLQTTVWKNLPNHGIDTCYYRGIQVASENSATGQIHPSGCGTAYSYHYGNDCKLRPTCN
jgi:hypothetical protein